jgi:hypothetical protein
VVYGAKDEKSMRALLPQYWEKNAGFHPVGQMATAPDRYCLVLQTDIRTDGPVGVNPSTRRTGRTVRWPSSRAQFGGAIPNHLDRLRGLWPYTLDQFFRVTRDSPEYRVEDKRWDYDAESWALVQYLLFGGEDIANRDAKRMLRSPDRSTSRVCYSSAKGNPPKPARPTSRRSRRARRVSTPTTGWPR